VPPGPGGTPGLVGAMSTAVGELADAIAALLTALPAPAEPRSAPRRRGAG